MTVITRQDDAHHKVCLEKKIFSNSNFDLELSVSHVHIGNILGMCISITELYISMHSLRYIEDTYEAASDTIHPYYDAVRFNFNSTQCDSMQWKKYAFLFLWFRQTANQKLIVSSDLLTP